MPYKFFYADYCEGKKVESNAALAAEIPNIVHSMDCVLHMPRNFFGIVNGRSQTIQFMVEEDHSILVDIPQFENGEYAGSKQTYTTLSSCLGMVRTFDDNTDFSQLIR